MFGEERKLELDEGQYCLGNEVDWPELNRLAHKVTLTYHGNVLDWETSKVFALFSHQANNYFLLVK